MDSIGGKQDIEAVTETVKSFIPNEKIDPESNLARKSSDAGCHQKLNKINQDTAEQMAKITEDFKKAMEAFEPPPESLRPPTAEEWEKEIRKQTSTAMKNLNTTVDKAIEKAMKIIGELPLNGQVEAKVVFFRGLDFVRLLTPVFVYEFQLILACIFLFVDNDYLPINAIGTIIKAALPEMKKIIGKC